MSRILILSTAAVSAFSLSGCGGGGSEVAEDATVGITLEPAVETATAVERFNSLNEGFINVNSNSSLQTDLPSSGTVNYEGNIGFDVSGALTDGGTDVDASLVGDLSLDVDFGTDNITGEISNVLYADSDGNIDLTSGELDIAGDIDTVTVNGETLEGVARATATGDLDIDQGDGIDKNVDFTLRLSGQFGGVGDTTSASDPEAIVGFVVGEGTGDLTLNAPNGRFAADAAGAGLVD